MLETLPASIERLVHPSRHISLMRHGGPKEKGDTGPITEEGLVMTFNRLEYAYKGIDFTQDINDTVLIAHSEIDRNIQTAHLLAKHIEGKGGRVSLIPWSYLSEGNVGFYAKDLAKIGEGKRHFTEVWFDEDYKGEKNEKDEEIVINKSGKEALYGLTTFLLDAAYGKTFQSKNIVGIGHGPCMVLFLKAIQEKLHDDCLPGNWREKPVDDLILFGTALEFDLRSTDSQALYMPLAHMASNKVIRIPFVKLEEINLSLAMDMKV